MDSAKAVIPGVKVTVRNTDTDICAYHDDQSGGVFRRSPTSRRALCASRPPARDLRPIEQTGIVLETGQTFRRRHQHVGRLRQPIGGGDGGRGATLNTENGTVTGYVVTKPKSTTCL